MKPFIIAGFSGYCLEDCERKGLKLTPDRVRKYIKNHPSSGAEVLVEDIRAVLDILVQTSFLEIIDSNQEQYQRYIPCKYKRIKE
jgi:hypothetical protein